MQFPIFSIFKILLPLTRKITATGLAGVTFLISLLKNLDSRPRLGLCIMFGMLVFLLLPSAMSLNTRILAGWTLSILFFLTLIFAMMSDVTPQRTLYRAQSQEAQHSVVFFLVIISACTSIFAIALIQANNQNIPKAELAIEVVLSIMAIVCAWFLCHTTFALHYSTLYYRKQRWSLDEDCDGGLDFPGETPPDYWDFMYFAFTIGMTAQTSDVAITSATIRHLSLAHALVSFFFYMVIVASSVNVASGLI